MKAGRAKIGIFQKMRIKNLRGGGVSEVRFKKKLDYFTLETSKNHLIRNFLRNGRLRVKMKFNNNENKCRRFGDVDSDKIDFTAYGRYRDHPPA